MFGPIIDLGVIDLSFLTDAITGVVPQILPTVLVIQGIRKAVGFAVGMVRGA